MNLGKIQQIVGWTLIVLLVLWIALNFNAVDVHFLIGSFRMPVAFVILLSAGAGAGAVYAFQYIRKFKKGGDEPPK
jgi:uncharacterized integral membrane protein